MTSTEIDRIAILSVWQESVAGIDGEAGLNSDIATRWVQEAKSVAPPRLFRAVALLLVGVVVVVLKAATSGLVVLQVSGGLLTNVIQGVDDRSRDVNAAAIIYSDGVSRLALAADLEPDVLDQTGGVGKGTAGGAAGKGEKLGDAGRLRSDLNLV